MQNIVWSGVKPAGDRQPERPDHQVMAAHVTAGGSPFDFVDRPAWFSYSAFDAFQRCPRQYALRYLCRVPADQVRPAAEFGTAAHAAFEAFTRERRERLDRGDSPPTSADLGRFFESAWAATSLPAEAGAAAWMARAEPMLDRFWAAESGASPDRGRTFGEELRFRLRLPLDLGFVATVAGFVDRVDRLPSGRVELIDYKTGIESMPEDAGSSLQLSIYALACRDALGLGLPERVTFYFVEQDRRLSADCTDAAMDGLRAGLADRARQIRGSNFVPTPSARACGWCDFAAMCSGSSYRSGTGTSG
jgi:RecB family exonuclease